jgi:pimeloyl-ACP methyl ester carboxylesterase
MTDMIFTIVKFAAISVCITLAIALVLIVSDRPKDFSDVAGAGGPDFQGTIDRGISSAPEQIGVTMRDGWDMPVRRYGTKDARKPLLIVVHGSGWVGLQFNDLAKALADDAYVVAPDLRGHGASPERRGDVDYIDQMGDDIADLIAAERLDGQQVVLAGHSSGGGLVIRFAGGPHGGMIDRAVLLAPFLKYNAPTTRQNAGGWAHALTRRIIGLSMLNTFRITALNHLTAIQFNMPAEARTGKYGHLATLAYSFRLNTGFAPRSDYLGEIAALPEFALIAGEADEAFFADKYEEVMSAVTDKGTYLLVPGASHLGVIDAPQTQAALRQLLQ